MTRKNTFTIQVLFIEKKMKYFAFHFVFISACTDFG